METIKKERVKDGWLSGLLKPRILRPYVIQTNCCVGDLSVLWEDEYALYQEGIEYPLTRPEEADLLILSGPCSLEIKDQVLSLYKSMPESVWVFVIGTCFGNSLPQQIPWEECLPVDYKVTGCPPDLSEIKRGLLELRKKIIEYNHG